MVRKSYDKQFKMAAVKMIVEEDIPVKTVAKELKIHQNTVYRWLSEYKEYGEDAFLGHGSRLYSYQYEKNYTKKIKFLRRNLNYKKYRAFLKKKSM